MKAVKMAVIIVTGTRFLIRLAPMPYSAALLCCASSRADKFFPSAMTVSFLQKQYAPTRCQLSSGKLCLMLGQYRYGHFHFILPVFILLCVAEIFFFLSPAPNREQ